MQAGVAGVGVVLASIASALVNLPIIHRIAPGRQAYKRLSYYTIVVTGTGVLILLLQRHFWSTGR
jgi:hypothetical protein